MPPQAAAGQLSQVIAGLDDLALRQLWRILQVMKLRENAPLETLKALLPAAEDELTRRTSTAPAADVPSLPKLEAYSGLMEQYNQTMEAHSPEHASETVVALERLLAGAEQLVAVEPVDYLRADIASYLGTVLTATANCFKVLGKVAPARACLERAIAEAEAHGLGSLADDCHLKLAELLVTQAGDFDRALRDLLPLQQSMSVREPSLARARISTLLAETCVNAGDFFAARQALQKAEDDLRKLGYAPPDPENLDRTLAGWIDTADRATTDPNAFRQALYGTQTLYLSIENIRSRTDSSPDQQAVAMRMVESLVRLNNGLVARDQEVVQRDQRIIDRFGQAPGSDHPQKTEMVAFDEKLEALGGRINELFTAVQAEAPPEPPLSVGEIL